MKCITQYFVPVFHCFQTSLRDYGRDSLEKEFRQMLNRHSKPVPVETILKLSESEESTGLEMICLPYLKVEYS